ncbi:uncharacterized protein LOC126655201 isoform X1 [Mercurialis annua]|uniref:uncharacterized protein LOC126655201 isoform X1 n=1 Tax=Mercurialis annua TaxID=3986 RepID=UPI0024ADB540|nr:uncharacterized protein LOC126655201 isoform X1 [Mercurialis annua]
MALSQNNPFILSTTKSIATSHATARPSSRRSGSVLVTKMAMAYEEGELERPKWAGQTPLSRLVGALLSIKPLSAVLKLGARQVLISTAEKKNIPWREIRKEILESDVYKEIESIQNPSIVYPDYYRSPFHGYDEGNLSWMEKVCAASAETEMLKQKIQKQKTQEAAAEAEPATMSMVRRSLPNVASLEEGIQILRGNVLKTITQQHQTYSGKSVIDDILDIGCSVGVSTRFLADSFPSAKVSGLDLSPHFLSVAQFKEKKSAPRKNPITWIHANGEDTGLPSKSYDLITISFVIHECPERAIVGLIKEASRLLKPGGTIALTDIAPKSKILQELSPVLFTLLKSTEPFLDEYYLTDLEGRLKEAGFLHIQSLLTDPRHRTVTATAPPSV